MTPATADMRVRDVGRFRHDPQKNTLVEGGERDADWTSEPAVCAHRRLTYHNRVLGRDIRVPVSATPVAIAGAGVVVASDDGFIRFHDPSLSTVRWERRVRSSIYASLMVDRERRRVIVAATNGTVVAAALDGTVAWTTDTGVPLYATPTRLSHSDVLVLPSFGSRVVALDLASGSRVFDRPVPRPWAAVHGGLAAHRDPYASPAATDHDTVVVAYAEHVLALAADGSLLWQHEIGRAVKASPVVVDATGDVVVCSLDGRVTFLTVRDGAVRGELHLGAQVTASPALSGSTVAVGTHRGDITGINVHRREVEWFSPQGAPRDHTSVTILPDGGFAATTNAGNIVCLDPAYGSFRWESSQILGLPDHEPPMHITPVASVDGRMYCASYEGDLYQFTFRGPRGDRANAEEG
jgi:outer membrane protein assembly factor BamB